MLNNSPGEKKEYLTQQLITYIGNKRALLGFIEEGIARIQKKLQKKKLRMADIFSGSGIVARFFKQYSDLLIVNDMENYSRVINECYLSNEDEIDMPLLQNYYREMQAELSLPLKRGIVSELYAPLDDGNIKAGERVFFTSRNAMYMDTARQLIMKIPKEKQKYFLAPLLSEVSVHANTAGVFKGFYKERETKIGQFGGSNQDALSRIKGDIDLPFPVFSNFNCETIVYNGDSNKIAETIPEHDVAYLDPPYNQHPYGSNYFMLNLVLDYEYPENPSAVSGIPENWNRSFYNKKSKALDSLTELVEKIKSRYILISFNSEGFVKYGEMTSMLEKAGKYEVLETKYNTFRGSRNLSKRETHVKEYLFILEK